MSLIEALLPSLSLYAPLSFRLSFSPPFFIAYAISGTDASLSVFLRIEILEEYAEFPLEEQKIIIQQAQRICTTDEIMYIHISLVSLCVCGDYIIVVWAAP